MRATFILEASRSDGAVNRMQMTLDITVLSWLMRSIGL
jgi:hypothetical protein